MQVTWGEPLLKEFLNDGEIVGEGADGGQRRTIGWTAKAAGGGQQESGFDEVEADGPGVEVIGGKSASTGNSSLRSDSSIHWRHMKAI